MTKDQFDVLVARSGLPLSDAQKATLFGIWPAFSGLLARVSEPMPREAEPALIFQAEIKG